MPSRPVAVQRREAQASRIRANREAMCISSLEAIERAAETAVDTLNSLAQPTPTPVLDSAPSLHHSICQTFSAYMQNVMLSMTLDEVLELQSSITGNMEAIVAR